MIQKKTTISGNVNGLCGCKASYMKGAGGAVTSSQSIDRGVFTLAVWPQQFTPIKKITFEPSFPNIFWWWEWQHQVCKYRNERHHATCYCCLVFWQWKVAVDFCSCLHHKSQKVTYISVYFCVQGTCLITGLILIHSSRGNGNRTHYLQEDH